ncbi:MAG: sulfatase [Polyangiales bacterium]
MRADSRQALRAGVTAGLALAALDVAVAMARAGGAPADLATRALAQLSGIVFAATGFALAGWALARLRASLDPRGRLVLATALGAALGVLLGLALFSGSGVRRLGLRAPLVVAAVLASAAAGALSSRARAGWRPHAALLGAALLGLYAVHARVLVRQYPLVHGLLAAGVLGLAVRLALRSSPAHRAWGLAPLLSFLVLGATTGPQRVRSALRSHAPLGQYAVRVFGGRSAGAAPRSAPRSAPRLAPGPHLPIAGRDVILVTVDALRSDMLRSNGGRGRMPNADAMASRGLNFRSAYCSTPHTSYSLASLMLGAHARAVLAINGSGARLTLAQHLAAQGYTTAGLYPPAVFSVDRPRFGALATGRFGFGHAEERHADADELVGRAMAWLRARARGERVFLWVHFFEPHERYEVHAGLDFGADPRSRYESECAHVDRALGRLRREVAATGREVAWVLTADHGEEFGEHGGAFHGTTVYGEQVRVPLVMEVPGVPPTVIDAPVSLVDVAPTILGGLGLPRPARMTGDDLGPLVFGLRWERPVFAETGTLRRVTLEREALVADLDDGTLELFDLDRDPLERANLADARSERASALREEITRWEEANARADGVGGGDEAPLPAVLARAMQGERALAPEVAAVAADASRPEHVRSRALSLLAELAVRDDAIRARVAPLAEGDGALATEAGLTLALLGDARGLAGATRAFASSDPPRRRRAALALARLGDARGLPDLAATMLDPRAAERERDDAVDAVASLRDPRALPHWVSLLEDPRLAPRAAAALGALGDAQGAEALRRALPTMRYPLTIRATLGALATLNDLEAPRLTAEAMGAGDPLPELFSLLDSLREPEREVVGRRRSTAIAAGRSRALKLSRSAGAWAPLRRVSLRVRARGEGSMRVADQVDVALRAGVQEVTVDLPTPLAGHRLRVTPTVDLRVLCIAAR